MGSLQERGARLAVPLLVALWSATASAQPPREQRRADPQFDDSFDAYLAFGALNVPYGGQQTVDHLEAYDPGYQWGLGLGYFLRAKGTPFAASGGFFAEHALMNPDGPGFVTGDSEHVLRVGLELRAGMVLGERVFVYAPLRGGYATNVFDVRNQVDAAHGVMLGVGGGLDVAVTRRAYLGTVVGADLHYFRTEANYDLYTLTWRTHLGVRF